MWNFQSMDGCALPSGLAELEQLHVKLNSECWTSLHCNSIHCRWRKLCIPWKWCQGTSERNCQGLQCQRGSYMWSPAVSVVDISHSQTSAVIHLQARGQATPTHAAHEACCRHRFLVTHPKLVYLPQALPLSILLCLLSSVIGPGWKHQGTLRAYSSCVRACKARAPSEDLPGILVDWCHWLSGTNGQQNGEAFEGWCITVAR